MKKFCFLFLIVGGYVLTKYNSLFLYESMINALFCKNYLFNLAARQAFRK